MQNLEKRFETIAVEKSDKFTYLGMYVEIDKDGKYSIDMEDYIKNTVEKHMEEREMTRIPMVPAGKDFLRRLKVQRWGERKR